MGRYFGVVSDPVTVDDLYGLIVRSTDTTSEREAN